MKRLLPLLLVLSLCAGAELRLDYSGTAEGEVKKYSTLAVPYTTAGQEAECSVERPAVFAGGSYSYSCNVTTSPLEREEYEGGFFAQTEQTSLGGESGPGIEGEGFREVLAAVKWVEREVVYDPGYREVTNPCSLTLERGRGSCDEMALAAIGVLRKMGVPARYVSGVAFDGRGWVPHAWLEAAVDGLWVPFDPTFRQHGLLDGYHVVHFKGEDAREPIDSVSGSGSWAHAVEGEVLEEGGEVVLLELETPERLGGGGHGLVTVEARNLLPHPVELSPLLNLESENLEKGLEVVWEDVEGVVEEEGRWRWVVRAPSVEKGKAYAIPVAVHAFETARGEVEVRGKSEGGLEVYPNSTHYVEGEMAEYVVHGGESVVELESGEKKRGPRPVFVLPASEKTAFFSGQLFARPPSLVKESYPVDFKVKGPREVFAGETFEIVVEVEGPEREMELNTSGKSWSFTPPAVLRLSTSLEESGEIVMELDGLEVKKAVRVRGGLLALLEKLLLYLRKALM